MRTRSILQERSLGQDPHPSKTSPRKSSFSLNKSRLLPHQDLGETLIIGLIGPITASYCSLGHTTEPIMAAPANNTAYPKASSHTRR